MLSEYMSSISPRNGECRVPNKELIHRRDSSNQRGGRLRWRRAILRDWLPEIDRREGEEGRSVKLVTYLGGLGNARAGVLLNSAQVLDLRGAAIGLGFDAPDTVLELLDMGANGIELARTIVTRATDAKFPTLQLEDVRLMAPLPRPRKVLAVAGNYVSHIEEAGQRALEKSRTTVRPFIKPSSAVIGPDAPIQFPKWSVKLDYEAELAIVIGRRASEVSRDEAKDCIAGYSVFNDISGRELIIADGRTERNGDWFFDWLAGKWFDTFASFGPSITTADEVEDPHNLALSLSLNGERRQYAHTGQMIFNCFELVSFFSHLTTLEPGDIIATGTPAGVGVTTDRFLEPGDILEASIEGLGTLRNLVAGPHR